MQEETKSIVGRIAVLTRQWQALDRDVWAYRSRAGHIPAHLVVQRANIAREIANLRKIQAEMNPRSGEPFEPSEQALRQDHWGV